LLELLQLWAPRLEFLGLQACFALTRLVFRPWHELAHALVPRIVDRLYATLVNCVKLCERGRATALGQAGARLISLARTLPEPIVKKVLNKVVVHGKRLKWPGFEAPALELNTLNANLGPQAKTALRAHPRIVRSRTQHTGMSSEGCLRGCTVAAAAVMTTTTSAETVQPTAQWVQMFLRITTSGPVTEVPAAVAFRTAPRSPNDRALAPAAARPEVRKKLRRSSPL
jgi:hypothetical protein